MTWPEYQEAVMKLTEEFCGPIRLQSGLPWLIRSPLSRVPNAGIELRIGFIEDLKDE